VKNPGVMKKIFLGILPALLILFLTSMTSSVKLKKTQITDGISAKLPADFVLMSDDDIATRYPSTKKPLAMFSSPDRLADFGLNVTKSSWAGKDLRVLKDIYKSTLYTLYSDIQILKEEIVEINKQNYIVLEFISTADKTRKYTYMQYGIFKNRVYIFNFTSPENTMGQYQPVAALVMNSIKVNPGKLQDVEYSPSMVTTPGKGKKAKEVLQDQKQRNQSKPGSTTSK
jgi:hypothetical protein